MSGALNETCVESYPRSRKDGAPTISGTPRGSNDVVVEVSAFELSSCILSRRV